MSELRQKEFGKKVVVSLQGWAVVGGKRFFARSSWEYNIACYLEFLKQNNLIKDWHHELNCYWFTDWIKRGVVSYLPDFEVEPLNGVLREVWEVKGFMDSRSKTKISRFKKYYPFYKFVLIDKKRYYEIAKNKALFKGWGLMKEG